jgi:hypothetical protein
LLVAASIAAAPVLLGAVFTPLLRVLHVEVVHLCACGMPAGKCGCAECQRLERLRHQDGAPGHEATLRSGCSDDEAPIPATAVPPYVLPASWALREPALDRVVPAREFRSLHGLEGEGPPTPPPRARWS